MPSALDNHGASQHTLPGSWHVNLACAPTRELTIVQTSCCCRDVKSEPFSLYGYWDCHAVKHKVQAAASSWKAGSRLDPLCSSISYASIKPDGFLQSKKIQQVLWKSNLDSFKPSNSDPLIWIFSQFQVPWGSLQQIINHLQKMKVKSHKSNQGNLVL